MVQCEMCGTEVADPTTAKIEGAELDVCTDCVEFGTEVRQESTESTSTKYSTDSSSSSSTASSGTTSSTSSGGGGSRRDMFDEMDELAQDYDDRIRSARESRGLSQAELADQLNEKASLISKLEQGSTLPSDEVQRKLERALDVSLSAGGDVDEEWDGGSSTGEYTLGDVVKRKD